MEMDQDLVSFVIRFVRETSDSEQARWRGLIKHVQSNNETAFTEFVDALAFMQEFVNVVVQSSFLESQQYGDKRTKVVNPFLETTRLWGDFMPAYARKMSETMGEMIDTMTEQGSTKPMQQAMDNTLTAWGLPTRADQQRTAAALEAMNRQLAAMNAKLVDLENQISELKS